jgi:hypothetical protein
MADELIDAYELRQYREALLRRNGATAQEAAAGAAAMAAAAVVAAAPAAAVVAPAEPAVPAAAAVPAADANAQQQQPQQHQQQQSPTAAAGSGFIGANTFDEYASESVPLLQEQQPQQQQPVAAVAAAAPVTGAAAVAAQLKQHQQWLCTAVSAAWSSRPGRVTRLVVLNAAVLFVLSTLALHVPLRLGRALFTTAGALHIHHLLRYHQL